MTEKSKLQLADDIETAGVDSSVQRSMVSRLREGYYDEFSDDSPLDIPLVTLTADLRSGGLESFAVRVVNGDYDAGLEDSSHWVERQTGEVSDIIDSLGMRGEARRK